MFVLPNFYIRNVIPIPHLGNLTKNKSNTFIASSLVPTLCHKHQGQPWWFSPRSGVFNVRIPGRPGRLGHLAKWLVLLWQHLGMHKDGVCTQSVLVRAATSNPTCSHVYWNLNSIWYLKLCLATCSCKVLAYDLWFVFVKLTHFNGKKQAT